MMTSIKMQSVVEPDAVVAENDLGMVRMRISANVERQEDGSYVYDSILLPVGSWDYKTLVTALVRSKYSEDDMEAIVNNNLELLSSPSGVSEEESRNVASEFEQMQQWRKACKARAKELLAIGEEMGLRVTE